MSQAPPGASSATPPRSAGVFSLLLGGFALLWLALGLLVWLDAADASAGARGMKLVLSACVPISLVSLLLGLAGRSAGSRAGLPGIILSLLVLTAAFGAVIYSYFLRLA